MAERVYCSVLNDSEPLIGTAPVVDMWLLLEYRPPWKTKALPQSDLAAATQDWIKVCIEGFAERGLRVRPQLIRQPESDGEGVRLLVAHGGRLVEMGGSGYDFLQELDLFGLAQGTLPRGARVLEAPRYFVCTNGQRDFCCSRFGIPVYNALRERFGARVWQVNHLGGHRFAPNVLVLPTGVLHGRVHLESLDGFVAAAETGGISFAHVRGRTCYPKHVQAAEALSGRSDLKLLHVDGDERAATVTFAGREGSVRIAVKRSDEPIEVLSGCEHEALDQMFPYRAG